jgi:ATP-dependent DNA helicase RecG
MRYREDGKTELKREFTDDIKKELVAFANTEGGKLIIGVDDSGEVEGIKDALNTQLRFTNMIRDSIKPDLTMFVTSEIQSTPKGDILTVRIQQGTQRPYYVAAKGLTSSGVFVRQGTSSVAASETHIRKLIMETDGDEFESRRSMQQDLSFEYAEQVFRDRNIEFSTNHHVTLGLLTASPRIYSNVAFLLSDQCTFSTKVAIFQGTTKMVFKDRREFGGSILKQLNDVYEYIDLNNRLHSEISGLLRIDRRDVPEVAIREALLNAIIHREYGLSSSTLISILDDRIEFVSIGGLVAGLTIDDIGVGISVCRNEKLAAIFYRLQFIEAYGTGIAKIFEAYQDHPVKPTIVQTTNAFRITLPNLNASQSISKISDAEVSLEQMLVQLLQEKTLISRKDVQSRFNLSQTNAGNLLRNLVNKQVLSVVGAGKNTMYILHHKYSNYHK